MKNVPGFLTRLTVGLAASLLLASEGTAANLLFDVPDGDTTFYEVHGDGMIGYNFRIKETVIVSGVGWYDDGGDGLSRDFQVGLWRVTPGSTEELLGSGNGLVIPTSATLQGLWRVQELAFPLILEPGNYQIGGLDTADTPDPIRYVWQPSNEYSNPQADLDAFFYSATTAAAGPDFQYTTPDKFYLASGFQLGPMLFVVPEPSSLLLGALGAPLLLWRRVRKAETHSR